MLLSLWVIPRLGFVHRQRRSWGNTHTYVWVHEQTSQIRLFSIGGLVDTHTNTHIYILHIGHFRDFFNVRLIFTSNYLSWQLHFHLCLCVRVYVYTCTHMLILQKSVTEWMYKALQVELQDWQRDQEPDTDHEGFYQTSLPTIITQANKQVHYTIPYQ